MVPVTSSSSTPKTSFDFMKNNTLYTPSSYLSSKEEVLVTTKKLMEPYKTQNMSINPKEDQETMKKAPEEIGVFGAEKYFNGDMDSDQSSSTRNPEVDAKHSLKIYTGTPSVRSETSWNSQSVLLKNSLQEKKKKKNSGEIHKKKNFLSDLGCRCACSDGNSVDVDENLSVKRSSDPNISVPAAREIENQMNSSVKMNTDDKIKIQRKEDLVQRKSLVDCEKKKVSVQKKLTSVPWESRTEKEEEEDTKSDTSSDLFEIESLKAKPKPSLNRQGSDPASPTCYAPSEVSIEWSIVTASAADFSVMSECATSPVRRNRSSQIPRVPDPAKSALQRRSSGSGGGGGFLLSCKSLKSVRVSGDCERRSSMNKTSPIYVPSSETRRKISNSSSV